LYRSCLSVEARLEATVFPMFLVVLAFNLAFR
jgi:hypothetical protein